MRLKTLNGAPLSDQLDFEESSLLDARNCNAFHGGASLDVLEESSTPGWKWRRITPKEARLRSGWSQPYLPRGGSPLHQSELSFLIPNRETSSIFPEADTSILDTTLTFDDHTSEVDELMQHSLIFHDTLLSSQVLPNEGTNDDVSFPSVISTSFGTTTTEFSSPSRSAEHTSVVHMPATMTLTTLGSLPSASHLRSIYPQTPTPNFLCAMTTMPQQREILVRKGGYKMDLWEVTVADDTRSGFKVSFWLRPSESNNNQTNAQVLLLQKLEHLKVGDILLLRNVALTSFRDTVYGQSLNPTISRARTSIDVLMRGSGVSVSGVSLGGLPREVVDAFVRIKKWARTHVAADMVGIRKRKGSVAYGDYQSYASPDYNDSLPPDTMEAV